MKRSAIWFVLSLLMVTMLIMSSCQSAVESEKEGQEIVGQVIEKDTPTVDDQEEEEADKESPEIEKIDYSKPQYGGVLNGVIDNDPTLFDPYRHEPIGLHVMSFWTERPLWANWTTDRDKLSFMTGYFPVQYTTGCLLESWEQPDALTYIWHVRPGIHWQDIPPVNGRELVANDLVYTYHRQCGLGSGYTEPSPFAFFEELTHIESIEATDKYTVVIRMTDAQPGFPMYWGAEGLLPIVAPELIETYGAFGDWKDVAIGTGPFILEDYVKGSALTFSKNPNYWATDEKYPENRLPYIDECRINIISDKSTRLAALRTGKLDIMYGITGKEKINLAKSNPELKSYMTYSESKNIGMNYWAEPFTDRNVRKALQMAMDLETIADMYFKGYADSFPSLAGPGLGTDYWTPLDEYPEEVQEGFTYNPEKAKALLAEAGYPNGFTTNVVTRGFAYVDLLEITQAYLADIGVTLEINAMEYTTGNGYLYGRQHDQMYYLRASGHFTPEQILLYWYKDVAWNWGDINDPLFNERVDAVLAEADPVNRAEMIKEANVYGTSQFWGIFMPVEQTFNMGQPWIEGWQGEYRVGAYWTAPVFARVWINQDVKEQYK